MAEICLKTVGGGVRRFPLGSVPCRIGRSRENEVCLPDQWLSRHHAEIRPQPDGYVLKDLGSKNGTLLNDAPLDEPRRLTEGDVIRLGEHVLVFTEAELRDEEEPAGTRVFSAKEVSGVDTASGEPQNVARLQRLLAILSRAVGEMLVHRPLPELFETVLDLLFDAVPCERAAILVLEGNPPEPVVKASRVRRGPSLVRISRSIAKRVLTEKVCLILPNLMEDVAFKTQDSILASGIRSALCAPLWLTTETATSSERVIGLVYLDSSQRSHTFEEDDVRILTPLANVVAAKLESVRLLEESLEKRKLEQDLGMAADIQKALLPESPPSIEGYGIAGSNTPCRAVGGDYYDFGLHGGELLVALGDVSGKGTSAALLMTVLRAAVRASWEETAVSNAVSRINRSVCQNVPENRYMTFFLARLDATSGVLRYVNAGHNAPLLVRKDGNVETLEEGGTVLGMFEDARYSEGKAELRCGDMLVVFSDGVTETFSPTGEEFGENGLAEVCREARGEGAGAVQDRILSSLERFAEGAKPPDDRTLVVLKRD